MREAAVCNRGEAPSPPASTTQGNQLLHMHPFNSAGYIKRRGNERTFARHVARMAVCGTAIHVGQQDQKERQRLGGPRPSAPAPWSLPCPSSSSRQDTGQESARRQGETTHMGQARRLEGLSRVGIRLVAQAEGGGTGTRQEHRVEAAVFESLLQEMQ